MGLEQSESMEQVLEFTILNKSYTPDCSILKYWIPPPTPYQLTTSNFTKLAVVDSNPNACKGRGFTLFLLSASVSSITSFQGPFWFSLQ